MLGGAQRAAADCRRSRSPEGRRAWANSFCIRDLYSPTFIVFELGWYPTKSSSTVASPDHFNLVVGSGHKFYACNVVTRNATSVGVVFA
jgi:hypothetical protein